MAPSHVRVPGLSLRGVHGAAAWMLALGLGGCLLAFVSSGALGADGYAYPKEVALHASAVLAAALCLLAARRLRADAVDLCLAAFVALGALSLAVAAQNPWWGFRSLALSLSGALVFAAGRALARAGWGRRAGALAGVAVALLAGTALLEAYGVVPLLSLPGLGPGGTAGNRNRMAHLVAMGMPLLLLLAVTARGRGRAWGWGAALLLSTAAVTLARTRAAWLALLLAGIAAALLLVTLRPRLPAGMGRRFLLVAGLSAAGVAAAMVLPNDLSWRSESPYLDTARRMVEFREGSGRTRLLQYRNTARMLADRPLLGVGAGNWPVQYPRYATPGDPSYRPESLFPTSRLPHSDWLGLAAERGLPALLALLAAGALLMRQAWRGVRRGAPRRALHGLALAATLVCVAVLGSVDSVLLTPAGTFLALLLPGLLSRREGPVLSLPLAATARRGAAAVLLLAGGASALYSVNTMRAAHRYAFGYNARSLDEAVRLNPGDYQARMLLAHTLIRGHRCDRALPHLRAAARLLPAAQAPRRVWERCAAPDGGDARLPPDAAGQGGAP